MTTTRAVWIFLAALTALRLSMLGTIELEFDEAHYWMWSERLAPAYFSKGPGVAFAIRASTAVFGANEFGVRFFSPILAAGTSLLLYYFARRLFSEHAGFWVIVGINVMPIFGFGSFLMTIDPLSVFFWVAAMFTFWLAIERSPQFSWWWPATGLLIGLGFLSKYTNAFELISILLVLALAPRLRGEFKGPGLYALLAAFIPATIPPILWNSRNAWVTLSHLRSSAELEGEARIRLLEPLEFLGQHFLAYSPLIFAAIAWGVIVRARRVNQQFKVLFLFWFGLPVFLFYFLLSFNRAAAPNWDALAFPSFILLAIYFWRERVESRASLRALAGAAILIGLLASVVALNTDIIRSAGVPVWRRDPSDRMRGWKSATQAVETIRGEVEAQLGEKLFLVADSRDRASEISFYLRDKRTEGPGHPPVYIVESQAIDNQFSLWPRYDEFVETAPGSPRGPDPARPEGDVYTEEGGVSLFTGRSAFFIRDGVRRKVPHNIVSAFGSVDEVAKVEVRRFGRKVRRWQIFLCRDYRTLPL